MLPGNGRCYLGQRTMLPFFGLMLTNFSTLIISYYARGILNPPIKSIPCHRVISFMFLRAVGFSPRANLKFKVCTNKHSSINCKRSNVYALPMSKFYTTNINMTNTKHMPKSLTVQEAVEVSMQNQSKILKDLLVLSAK